MILNWPERDPKYRIIKSPDVANRGTWPKVPSNFVFIFEAINLSGSALFGEDWTGKELAAVQWLESPKEQRARGKQPAPINGGGGAGGSRSYSVTPARQPLKFDHDEHVLDWFAEQRQPIWEENERATERLLNCVEWLAQRCRDGDLTTYWRSRLGGFEVRPMRAAEWNVDNPLSTFVITGGNNRHCWELRNGGPFEVFVFFDKGELAQVLASQPNAPLIVGEADLSRLSPYLQMAVRMALKHGYTSREACDALPVREAEVRAAWCDFLPDVQMTGKAVEAIVKVIGFPDNRAIQAGQLAAARKQGGAAKA